MLPEKFLLRMQGMLADEYDNFVNSYNLDKYQALRVNTLKADVENFVKNSDFDLEQVPWVDEGMYYNPDNHPGKHPFHEAGVYYIQEPSAMVPGVLIDAQPGEKILDMCAAPGGKSTQIASGMKNEGILICNEINAARAKILSENVERMGIRNAIVTNESTDKLAQVFGEYFDKIMVDAPCSGEGMFRKNDNACDEWSLENVSICADRQDMILDNADHMLAPGGRIVYSTCTFAPKEDEQAICRFLERHDNYTIAQVNVNGIDDHGNAQWCDAPVQGIDRTIRIWPHKVKGEGHFAAVLIKDGSSDGHEGYLKNGYESGINIKQIPECTQFLDENLKLTLKGVYVKYGEQIYLMPENAPSIKGLKVLRPGLHLDTIKKNRFEPSHSLALALNGDLVERTVDISLNDKRIYDYISGQTFEYDGDKGWYLITVEGYSIGFGKLAGGIMKNHYPKGLRKQLR